MSYSKEQIWLKAKELFRIEKPLAITMWDFSWMERRWPGAGFEDWDQALTELTDRGYDAVRIEAYPHLVAKDIKRTWTLKPVWNLQDWGAPAVTRINLKDDFRAFLTACRRHHVRVALSSWFRQDMDNTHMEIKTPEDHARVWVKTLDYIKAWGELDNLLYVDMCNEFPLAVWASFFSETDLPLNSEKPMSWMKAAVTEFKRFYPEIPVTFSFCDHYDETMDVSCLDFLEPHLWMASYSDYYDLVGYHFERFDDTGYTNMALHGKEIYLADRKRFDQILIDGIQTLARWAIRSGKPLITTECWAVVDYKDWPLLDWDWVLELNRLGVETAVSTGCWAAIATSNFCAPQFVGMWRESDWHRQLTKLIHESQNGMSI